MRCSTASAPGCSPYAFRPSHRPVVRRRLSRAASFVRNPWWRLACTYRHKILAEKITNGNYQDGVHRGFVNGAFRFVPTAVRRVRRLHLHAPDSRTEKHLKSQSHFLVDRGVLVPAFIGRFETIARDWGELCGQLAANVKLMRYNRSHGAPYPTYYSTRLVNLVGDRYHEDVVRFGYDFEGGRAPQLPRPLARRRDCRSTRFLVGA